MDINKVIVVGRLTRDIELKLVGETSLGKFGLALEQGFGDKKSTLFIDCIVWGKQAEIMSKYLRKGNRLGIDGSLYFSSWEKDNQKRSKVEIKVDSFQSLEPKNNDSNSSNYHENQNIQQSFGGAIQDDQLPDPFA